MIMGHAYIDDEMCMAREFLAEFTKPGESPDIAMDAQNDTNAESKRRRQW